MDTNWGVIIVIAVVVCGYAIWQNRVVIIATGKKLAGVGGKGSNTPGKPL